MVPAVTPPVIPPSKKNVLIDVLGERRVDEFFRVAKEQPKLLLSRDSTGRQPLHWACSLSEPDVIEYILAQEGIDCDERDEAGWTPLMIAASIGNQRICEMLINANPDVNMANGIGCTALHYAASKNHPPVILMLLDHKADINKRDKYQGTALHRAASRGITPVVELLISRGASLAAKDNNGDTPLIVACSGEKLHIADILVTAGADIYEKNKDDQCALDFCKNKEQILRLQQKFDEKRGATSLSPSL